MRFPRVSLISFTLCAGLGLAVTGCTSKAAPSVSAKAPAKTPVATTPPAPTPCLAQASWFPHSQTPEPDNAGFQSTDNCVFHQWAWQTFLWLTQNVNGKPRFLSMQSPLSLIDKAPKGFFPRTTQANSAETFNEFLQAGSDGILVDQSGKAVYFSQYLDKTFADFITTNKLTDPAVVQKFDADTPFPIGAIELKASWKIVQPGEDTSGMFTMTGKVSFLKNENGKIVIDPNKAQTVELALVGFHIGGVVKGHPEMIWASFEQDHNAPNVTDRSPDAVVSTHDWTFYKAGTPYKDCNQTNTGSLKLDEATQTLSPVTQVCREYQYGSDPTNPKETKNINNIATLNDDVKGKLATDDVWHNYHEVGATWFNKINGLKPGQSLADDTLLTGSLVLSNATVETFTQLQSTKDSCFRCHNTMQQFPPQTSMDPLKAMNLNISKAFVNIYFWSQQMDKPTAKTAKVSTTTTTEGK